jgi:O-antigen/teichoic acid export membrane protein
MSDTAHAAPPMRSLVLRGIGWKFVSQIVLQSSGVLVAVVLARLLRPHDYGLAGMVLVATGLVVVFSDLALGAALIQRRELTDEDRSTAFWTGIAAGAAFTLVGIALSGPVADFYGAPKVQPLFAVFSLSFLIASLGATQKALLIREMNFRSLELRLMLSSLLGGALGIAAAALGYGAWAIITQQLTISVVSTALLWIVSPWRPKFTYSLRSLRKLGGFSGNVFGQRLLYQITRNADNLLIGRFLGPAAVGAYAIAYTVMLVPLSRLSGPITEVLVPALSRMQDDPRRVGSVWLRANRLIATVSIPALLGLMIVTDEFVHVVLGDHWRAAVPVLRILAWVGVLQAMQNLNEDVLMALDRTRRMFGFMVLWSCCNLAAFVIGLRWGIVGVAACFALAGTLLTPVTTILTGRVAGVSVHDFVANLAGVAQAAVVMATAVLLAKIGLVSAGVSPTERLALLIPLGILVYVPLAVWRVPDVVAEIRRLRPRPAGIAISSLR